MTKTFTKCMIILLLAVLGLSTGCAKLVWTKRLDMGPFGENTTTMVNDIQLGLLNKKPLYIKPYLTGPDVVEFRTRWLDLQKVLRGIVFYSTQVVSLSRSSLKGPERAAMHAQYVEALTLPLIENKNSDAPLTRADLDAALGSIRSKETLIAALGAAQPMVDAVQNFSLTSFEKLHELAQRVLQETQVRIDMNSAVVLEHAARLKTLQSRSLTSYALLSECRMGDPKALDALLTNDPELKPYCKADHSFDARSLDSMEKVVVARLQTIALLSDQIRPQLEQYRSETRELDDLVRANDDTFRKARVTMQMWARSHGNLAAGIDVPPPIDMVDILSEAATGAAKKVLTIH
jgi:hypothetical protein